MSDSQRDLNRIVAELNRRSETAQDKSVDLACDVDGLGRFRATSTTKSGTPAASLPLLPADVPIPDELHLPAALDRLSALRQASRS